VRHYRRLERQVGVLVLRVVDWARERTRQRGAVTQLISHLSCVPPMIAPKTSSASSTSR
jgi:hypothetical protein